MRQVAVMHPAGLGAWVCSFQETPSEPIVSAHDQFIFDLGEENRSMRQQLEALQAHANDLANAVNTMLVATTDDGKEQFEGHYALYLEGVAKPRAREALAAYRVSAKDHAILHSDR